MTDTTRLPSEDWILARDALERLGAVIGDEAAADQIISRAKSGLLDCRAEKYIWYDTESPSDRETSDNAIVPRRIWELASRPLFPGHRMWKTNDMTFYGVNRYPDRSGETHELYNLRFRKTQLDELLPSDFTATVTADSGQPERSAPRNKGGRPSGTNGEPIATFTLRLLADWPFDGETNDSLGARLEGVYKEFGLSIAADNARKDAIGVVRAIKKAKEAKR